jgi:transposase
MFSYLSPEERVPANHPLRPIRLMVDDALKALSPSFSRLYSAFGRPSIPPEKLLRALLLQVLYTVRSERMLMEQLEYNLLFRWFVGLNMDETVWAPTVFTKNRDRLLEGDIAEKFFAHVLAQARIANLLSDEHDEVYELAIERYLTKRDEWLQQRCAEAPGPGAPRLADVVAALADGESYELAIERYLTRRDEWLQQRCAKAPGRGREKVLDMNDSTLEQEGQLVLRPLK